MKEITVAEVRRRMAAGVRALSGQYREYPEQTLALIAERAAAHQPSEYPRKVLKQSAYQMVISLPDGTPSYGIWESGTQAWEFSGGVIVRYGPEDSEWPNYYNVFWLEAAK